MNLKLLFILTTVLTLSKCYKLLVGCPFPIKSLNILSESVAQLLSEAGHEVTYITVFPSKSPNKNYRLIDVSETIKSFEDGPPLITIADLMINGYPPNDLQYYQEFGTNSAIAVLNNANIKDLLEDTTEKFDAVIVDFFETDLLAALAVVYDAPLIYIYSMGAHLQALRLIDQPTNPAYTSGYMTSNNLPFGFKERVEELWNQIQWYWYKIFTERIEEEFYKKYFEPLLMKRGRALPDFQKIIYNASLILANEHHSIGHIPSTPQNFKFVGGHHIQMPVKALPKDLQALMDSAKNGVIYFSLGSIFKSKDVPKHITENMLKMFGELNQTVIWKYEDDLLNLPKNVHILKWAPQNSILSHPNCLFFITHGGLLSATEAIHFGVPTIGIPLFLDQIINVKKGLAAGYAEVVLADLNLDKNLKVAINKILTDERYTKRAKEVSAIFHDRVVPPKKELVFWIEHAIRTKGALHLRSPALEVTFYQKHYLDLICVLLIVTMILIWAIKKIMKTIKNKSHVKSD